MMHPTRRLQWTRGLCKRLGCLAALPAAALAAGCASWHVDRAYIHDDAAQKAAESAQSSWQSGDPTKLLDAQKDFYAKLSADEAATVRASIIARRDLQLISLMRGDGGTVALLRGRLTRLTGMTDTTARTLNSLAALDKQVSQARTRADLADLALADARTLLRTDGFQDDVSDCSNIHAPPAIPLPTDPRQADLLLVSMACDDKSNAEGDLNDALNRGFARNQSGKRTGELGFLVNDLEDLTAQSDAQNRQKLALQRTLASLKDPIDHPKDPGTVKLAKSALKFCGADPDSAAAAGAANPDNATALQQAFPACLTKAGKGLDAAVKLVKHSHLADEIQSALTQILSTSATAAAQGTAPAPTPIAASTRTALQTLSYFTQTADTVGTAGQPGVNALLVALAYEQHEIAMCRLAARAAEERRALLLEKREALIGEISHLARALQSFGPSGEDGTAEHGGPNDLKVARLLAGRHEGAGAVLTEVASSWNVGRYRAELADYADIDLTRRTSLYQATEVVGSWKNVLQPAFDELVAYGKGGLDSQTVATLVTAVVNAGGLSAIAARVGY